MHRPTSFEGHLQNIVVAGEALQRPTAPRSHQLTIDRITPGVEVEGVLQLRNRDHATVAGTGDIGNENAQNNLSQTSRV